MRAYERLVADDGYEVLLFPLEYLYCTQDEGGSISHTGTLNMDFQGWSSRGRIYNAPLYAPCTCKCVAIHDTYNNGRVFESVEKVHTANGGLQYITFMFYHDSSPIASVGDVFNQGDLIGHTGTAGQVTGDHTHLNTAYGKYQGFITVSSGHSELKNSSHIYTTMYVNDTVIKKGLNHRWVKYDGGRPIIVRGKHKFKWVLYARKLRFNYGK